MGKKLCEKSSCVFFIAYQARRAPFAPLSAQKFCKTHIKDSQFPTWRSSEGWAMGTAFRDIGVLFLGLLSGATLMAAALFMVGLFT